MYVTNLKRKVLIWLHETDALEMVVRATGTLLLSVRRERRAAGTLTFSTVCTKGGAYRVSEGTGLLLVASRSETSACVAATE